MAILLPFYCPATPRPPNDRVLREKSSTRRHRTAPGGSASVKREVALIRRCAKCRWRREIGARRFSLGYPYTLAYHFDVTCRRIVALLLACVWSSTPLLICLPNPSMTPAEMECCRKMAGNCDMGGG